jgi:DNA polymerase-3 subunit delta'
VVSVVVDDLAEARAHWPVDPWAEVVGQRAALDRLEAAARAPVHAYLFLGSLGSGSAAAALGFAGLLLAEAGRDQRDETAASGSAVPGPSGSGDEVAVERHIRLAVEAKHPDLVVVEAEGSALRVSEADQIIRAGLRSPIEGRRKVIVVKGVDAIEEAAVGKLLKVIEEPPASAVFVLLAEEVPPELVTIVSRCVTVDFGPLSIQQMTAALVERGIAEERALTAATAAGGDFERARLLAADEGLAARAELWGRLPERLDGTGSTVGTLVQEIRAGMDQAQVPLEERQATELQQLEERVEQLGERGSGRAELVARHKRELRRLRSDELRFGMATLARAYRDRLVAAPDPAVERALGLIQTATENLIRNPNEALLLQDLLLQIGGPGR